MTTIEALQKYFGYNSFRTGQEEIINSICANKTVVAVLPTGAGKSICYQIPAMLSSTFAIVVSPLIALMKDQVDSLNKNELISGYINSSLDYKEGQKVLYSIQNKEIKILYVSPEKLANRNFAEQIRGLAPQYLFIDEAHCISEWGHSFRPSYRKIKEFISFLGIKNVSAFTATATKEVIEDIVKELELTDPKIFVKGFERTNLHIKSIVTKSKKEETLKLIKNYELPAIIYTATRKNCEEIVDYLRVNKINSAFYHAGLSSDMKRLIQDDFISGRTNVIAATNAFGMGIDKSDIRTIIHYNMPGSIESYYQEIGRAGRDGKESFAHLLYDDRDKQIQEYFINSNQPTRDELEKIYDAICDYGKVALGHINSTPILHDQNLDSLFSLKRISSSSVESAFRIFEDSEYITLKTSFESMHQVRFLSQPDKLHTFIKNHSDEELKDLLVYMVRKYGASIFNKKIRIDLRELGNYLEININEVIRVLEYLSVIGAIEFDHPSDIPQIMLTKPRILSKSLHFDLARFRRLKERLVWKLGAMTDLVFTNECRMKFIVEYFGQESQNYKCGKCDNCTDEVHPNFSISGYIDEIILRTLHEAKSPIKIKTLTQILLGKATISSLKKFSTYESCVHFNKDDITNTITVLQTKKLVLVVSETISLSENGMDFFTTQIEESSANDNIDYEEELKIFNTLRELRKEAANKFGQSPQLICTDEILRLIARQKPVTPSALLKIDGFNQRIFNKVGDEFLNAIIIAKEITDKQTILKSHNLSGTAIKILNLIEEKYSFENIAKVTRMPELLLAVEIEKLIGLMPNLDIRFLFDKKELGLIKKEIDKGITDIKELQELFEGKISFSKIRIAVAKLLS